MSEIVCISPIDGSVVDRRPTLSGSAIEAALTAARQAQREWAATPLAERCAKALAFLDAMLAMKDEVVPELAWQMGRPVRFGGEFGPMTDRVRYMVANAEAFLAPLVPAGASDASIRRFIRREPLGVVFTIAPWNYPYLTAVNSVVPALVAGNAVLLKHAAQTILVGDRFQMAMDRAGLPKGLFQTLALSHEDTSRIISAGAVDLVCFTGSTAAGQVIERAAAGTFTNVGLELGGKDPAYVRADANLEHAIENLVDGAFYNSGQCCCGIERIYVHESLYDRFVEGAAALAAKYVLGDPRDQATTLGPMAQARLAQVVRDQTAEALAMGAKALIDTTPFAADRGEGAYLAPQVLVDVDHRMRVMTEESFGPVVGIMKVSGDEEALKLMNDSVYGLTAAIWTSDVDAAQALGERIETGTVFMNRCDYLDPGLAWTGVKDTGRGATLSKLGYDALTRPKSFHLRSLA
ncbi:aldehyde dehydrogenase family protein [Phenylobacterium montanum]|uniref:Aldehyde dehydrogenase family protein n=1 Tax=Phenylobacterium montanum TaxID=2823693 RepID=A0A975IWE3_9CAUL|nr:aldehyde dehydrogenase family protein [Caulobacter sp. S6]QUD88306.1 aldehyde dehydrogenase family protein [Caulobacter sp. S6]